MDICLTNYKGEIKRFKQCNSVKDKYYGNYQDYLVKYENKQLIIANNNINKNQILMAKGFIDKLCFYTLHFPIFIYSIFIIQILN